jgi:outer membrane protein assembly factor BamB
MRLRITALLLAAAFGCAGCGMSDTVRRYLTGGEDNAEPPAPLVAFDTKLRVIELWSRGTPGVDEQYLKLAPALSGQRLFIAAPDGDVVAVDATNGNTLWDAEYDDELVTGGPGTGENMVFLGTSEGRVIALHADSGRRAWTSRLSSEILSPPLRADGIVVARTNDGKVYGLDGGSGRRVWVYDRSVPALTLRGTSTPAIDSGLVVAGFDAGRLAALDLRNGKLLWEAAIATARGRSELERMVDIDSDPIIYDGTIYVASFQGQLAAVQLESGRILWTREISSHAGFTVDDNYVYVTDDESHVRAFDRFSGGNVWNNEKLHARGVTGPARIGDYLVVGDMEGFLHWMDRVTGEFVARIRLSDARIIVPPQVVGKVLYAFSSDGELAAYTYR